MPTTKTHVEEDEYKLLLYHKYYSPTKLRSRLLPEAVWRLITQQYLIPPEPSLERRVRRSERADGKITYTETIKKPNGNQLDNGLRSRIEDDEAISKGSFEYLRCIEADPRADLIVKARYTLRYDGCKLDFDFFRSPSLPAVVLEIELDTPRPFTEITLPHWISRYQLVEDNHGNYEIACGNVGWI